MARAYRTHMATLSTMSALEVWYSHVEADRLAAMSQRDSRDRLQKALDAGRAKSVPEVLTGKLTTVADGKLRFRDLPPLVAHFDGVAAGEEEKQAFASYVRTLADDRRLLLERYELVDVAMKVVGIGSVGTVCGMLLLASAEDDVLVLQIKEARPSVLEPYAGASTYPHHGQRVVNGQRLMQAASDMFLGWTTGTRGPRRHFFVRQLKDVKVGANTALWTRQDYRNVPAVAGEILARAHARSFDASVLRGYLGKSDEFDEAIATFAVTYAQQAVRDHEQFTKACRSGRLPVQTPD
jgi:uncharacterized protein (DUF2252 family)